MDNITESNVTSNFEDAYETVRGDIAMMADSAVRRRGDHLVIDCVDFDRCVYVWRGMEGLDIEWECPCHIARFSEDVPAASRSRLPMLFAEVREFDLLNAMLHAEEDLSGECRMATADDVCDACDGVGTYDLYTTLSDAAAVAYGMMATRLRLREARIHAVRYYDREIDATLPNGVRVTIAIVPSVTYGVPTATIVRDGRTVGSIELCDVIPPYDTRDVLDLLAECDD